MLSYQPSRRTVLKGAAALGAVPVLAACSGGAAPEGGGASSNTGTSIGSALSDAKPKAAIQAMVDAYHQKSGKDVRVNVMPREQLIDNVSSYLQSNPEDAITWYAGYRLRFYAEKGLLAPVDDVWEKIGTNFGAGLADASSSGGKKYLVPNYNYPWVVFYRKSVWKQYGYEVPTTFDELLALCARMKKDGLSPIAFSDKDGWEAMGMFDYLNMRTNGYQFHVDLLAHKETWDSPKVKATFDNWNALRPFQDTGALGQSWQQAARNMANKKSGMFLVGTFLMQELTEKEIADDLDFFAFPEIAVEGQDAVEAPIDGWVLSARGGKNPVAKDMLAFFGTGAAQDVYAANDPSNLQTAADADRSKLSPIQKKAAELIANSKRVSQFFDRDALPAMAKNVITPTLQSFIKDGKVDLGKVESQAKTLYASA
jgi:multiple sugar transport system substrate-binding protein